MTQIGSSLGILMSQPDCMLIVAPLSTLRKVGIRMPFSHFYNTTQHKDGQLILSGLVILGIQGCWCERNNGYLLTTS